MGWDAIVTGELSFPSATQLARWKRGGTVVAAVEWPLLLGPLDDEDVGRDFGSVSDALAALAASGIEVRTTGSRVTLAGHVGEDDYRELQSQLVGALSAAVACGAKGRCEARDAGTQRGGAVALDGKRLVPEAIGSRTSDADADAVLQLVLAQERQNEQLRAARTRAGKKAARTRAKRQKARKR